MGDDKRVIITVPNHIQNISTSLHKLQQNGFLCDTKLIGQDGYVSAHAVVLSAASLQWKETIQKAKSEDEKMKDILFEKESVSDLKQFVDLLYIGSVTCTEESYVNLLRLFKLFGIETLKSEYSQNDESENQETAVEPVVDSDNTNTANTGIMLDFHDDSVQASCDLETGGISEKAQTSVIQERSRVSTRSKKSKEMIVTSQNHTEIEKDSSSSPIGKISRSSRTVDTNNGKGKQETTEEPDRLKNMDLNSIAEIKRGNKCVQTNVIMTRGKRLKSTANFSKQGQTLQNRRQKVIDRKDSGAAGKSDTCTLKSSQQRVGDESDKCDLKSSPRILNRKSVISSVNVDDSQVSDDKEEIAGSKKCTGKEKNADVKNTCVKRKNKNVEMEFPIKDGADQRLKLTRKRRKVDGFANSDEIDIKSSEGISTLSESVTKNKETESYENFNKNRHNSVDDGKTNGVFDKNGIQSESKSITGNQDGVNLSTDILSDNFDLDGNCGSDLDSKKCRRSQRCYKCSVSFNDFNLYLTHMKKEHPDLHKTINIENRKNKESLITRNKREDLKIGNGNPKGNKKERYCKSCDIVFPDYKAYVQHRKEIKHFRKNHLTTFKCNYCEYTTKVECYLDMHKIKKHSMDLKDTKFEIFRCEVKGCDYFNLRKSILDQHMLDAHNSENSEVCDVCGKTFRSRKQLKNHIKIHIPKDQRELKFKCPECDRKFERKADFSLHFKHQHKKEKSFLCHLCPYGVTAQRLLDIHLFNVHHIPLPNNITLHTCSMCDYSTPYKHYLDQHINRHKGDACFQCHICNKAFSAKPNLTAHLWRHKTQNKKCPYENCKYEGRGQKMKDHIRFQHTHKNEKPYRCPMCSYQGKTRSRVRSHLIKLHKLKTVQQENTNISNSSDTIIIENAGQGPKPITHVTANGNIELDTMVVTGSILDNVVINDSNMESEMVLTTGEYTEIEDCAYSSETVVAIVDSSDIVVDRETEESVTQVIMRDDILSAIQDSKNVIIYQQDGSQYGAIEVVDYNSQ